MTVILNHERYRMARNNPARSVADMSHEALNSIFQQVERIGQPEVNLRNVRLTMRHNGVAGTHVHASASLITHLRATAESVPPVAETV
jgi:hypothetical protein